MKVAVLANKGGVGKSVTGLHVAAYFSKLGKTLFVDGDPNESVIKWNERGGLPFDIVPASKFNDHKQYQYGVFDTEARPAESDIDQLAKVVDLFILPTIPDMTSIDGVVDTIRLLKTKGLSNFKVLVTFADTGFNFDAEDARDQFKSMNIPVFNTVIFEYKSYRVASREGIPVHEAKHPSAQKAGKNYDNLSKEIIDYNA